jgi:type VI secretion system protein ImpF
MPVARNRNDRPLLPSVLDRLLDDEPGGRREAAPSPSQVLRELKQSVRRDLENVLNTRVSNLTWEPHLSELNQSLLTYGLPDFSAANLGSAQDREAFCDLVRAVITRLEARLMNVNVVPLTAAEPLDRTFRLRIDAVLRTEPAPEPVVFDSSVEPATGDVQVREAAG